MLKAIKIKLDNGQNIHLYIQHVCYVLPQDKDGKTLAALHMSNGEVLLCQSPSYDDWYNDCLIENLD